MSILSYDRCCGVKIELFTCNHIARLKPHPSLPLDGERELNFTESFIIQSSLIKRGKHSSLVLQTIYWRCFHNHREGLYMPLLVENSIQFSILRDCANRWIVCSSSLHCLAVRWVVTRLGWWRLSLGGIRPPPPAPGLNMCISLNP